MRRRLDDYARMMKKKITSVRPSFNHLLFLIPLIVLVYSLYQITDTLIDRYQNKQTYAAMKDIYYSSVQTTTLTSTYAEVDFAPADGITPASVEMIESVSNAGEVNAEAAISDAILPQYQELLAVNKDVVGWIRIGELELDYPVVQGEDNDYYLDHDVMKQANKAGSIFMDYRNEVELNQLSDNTILYGHNMKDRSMFAEILRYESRWYFEKANIIDFGTIYEDMQWEIFSAYRTTVDFNYLETGFASEEEYEMFIQEISERSIHETEVSVTAEDKILTLSTCTDYNNDDERFVVHAKLITD